MTLTNKGIPLLDGGSDQPGTDDFADVADINAAFRKINSLVGVTICTTLSKPSEPVDGELILELDTGAFSVFNAQTNNWVLLSSTTSNVPVGTILTYAGATPPTSYMFAEGASLLKSAYPALFTAIGTQYGSASALHFNCPNLKGRTVVGMDTGQTEFTTLGQVGGSKTHTLNLNEIPAHTHATPTSSAPQVGGSTEVGSSAPGFDYIPIIPTGSAGGGLPHNNLQPYAAMRFIIKF